MKLALVFISLLVTAMPVLANDIGKSSDQETQIFCPEKITCYKAGDLSSCKYSTNFPQYWGRFDQSIPNISEGVYDLANVKSSFHAIDEIPFAKCIYGRNIQGQVTYISLESNRYSNIEAYMDINTNWRMEADEQKQHVACAESKELACPLKVISGFGAKFIGDKAYGYHVAFGAGDDGPSGFSGSSDDFQFVRYDNLARCWVDKICSMAIFLRSSKPEVDDILAGYVYLDMNNHAKIVNIQTINPNDVSIAVNDSLNYIQISKAGSAVLPHYISIQNNLAVDISLTPGGYTLGSVRAFSQGDIELSPSVLKDGCLDPRACKVDVRGGRGLVGSIIIDTSNNAIISIQTTRPSEMMISQVSPTSIVLNYPFK